MSKQDALDTIWEVPDDFMEEIDPPNAFRPPVEQASEVSG